jgi:hypothetical protein
MPLDPLRLALEVAFVLHAFESAGMGSTGGLA